MKKILIYIPIVFMVLFASSCKEDDAGKDVDAIINKLKQFNDTYKKFAVDGISKGNEEKEDEKSEFNKLKKIANEYYDLMNKANKQIKNEKAENGTSKYEVEFKKAIDEKKAKIKEATDLFIANMNELKKE